MNYVCVSVNKEIVNRETFYNKLQALNYFESLHGEAIVQEKHRMKNRLRNSIKNYDCKMKNHQLYMENAKAYGVLSRADQEKLEMLSDRKAQREAELKQLELDLCKQEVSYMEKCNDYKKAPWSEVPQMILHITGIYQRGYVYSVVEEKYYCIGAKINSDEPISKIVKKLPPQFDTNRISLYLFQEMGDLNNRKKLKDLKELIQKEDFEEFVEKGELETMMEREDLGRMIEMYNLYKMQKEVNRVRSQILRDFQKSPTRIIEI